jgi:glycosyltransferase involved in cell wall biosynthesis
LNLEYDEDNWMRMNQEKPKVSVVVPTYNSERTLSKCLKSVQNQSYPYHETIVVDNFSHDNTINVAKSFGAIIIQRKCNPAAARNVAVASSTGQHVLFLDSDQVLSAGVIEECVEKSAAVGAGMVRIIEVFVGKGFWSRCSAVWKNSYEKVERTYWHKQNILRGEPRFFIKEQIVRTGMFNERLLWGEDYDLYERMKKMGIKEATCESVLYHFEPTSIGKILSKLFLYGKSLQDFRQNTGRRVFSPLFHHSSLTLTLVIRNYRKSPDTVIGCTILLLLKTYYLTIGLLAGLLNDKPKR